MDASMEEISRFLKLMLNKQPKRLVSANFYESILPELSSLEQLDIYFIGPALTDPAARAHLERCSACQNCSKVGKTLDLSYWPGRYHAFVQTIFHTKPDVAAAQQSGLPRGMEKEMNSGNSDGGTLTIKRLLEASQPAVVTSMDKGEMVTETALLWKLRAHFMQNGEVNKWHSMAPINEGWYRPGVFYRNYYWSPENSSGVRFDQEQRDPKPVFTSFDFPHFDFLGSL